MMDWTDRHCRAFHRMITQHTRLYTEMVTTGALIHGDVARHLQFNAAEHPLALQLGGSEPADLAHCARLGEQWGYDEINLNCGCPSERVQRGAFGACLMAEPLLVRDCIKAMVDAVQLPVTVKHRIGIDKTESYAFVRDFVGTVAEGGCSVFIVHARNAWLQGLSPKENREVPPLRYEFAHQLKRDFPQLTIVINGGIKSNADIAAQLEYVDGVMVGREAYHHPWLMSTWDDSFFTPSPALAGEGRGEGAAGRGAIMREHIEQQLIPYLEREVAQGTALHTMTRHLMGLWNGQPGARRWRQVLSDNRLRGVSVAELFALARRARMSELERTALAAR
jgi:tRNA-dihydrouridine synthase A